jgi:two-component system response regulator FixJ
MTLTRHVYVVDDDSMVRTSTVFFLRSSGYTAHPLRNGQEFLSAVPDCKPGCVLLDIRMPEIDGLQVIELLGERIAQLPVIIMTGHGDIATAVRAMKLGASDFLEKPFEEDVLVETIERVFAMLGEHVLVADRCANARQRIDSLTKREDDVLRGLASGLSNKVLAYRLGLSVRTVEMHRSNMMNRLAVRSLPEALRLAYLAGAVPTDIAPELKATAIDRLHA